MNVCIIGGGSLGHVCAGVFASQEGVSVNIYTQHPQLWSRTICVTDINEKQYVGTMAIVSNVAQEVVVGADMVFLCLPGFLIEETLRSIKPYLSSETIVGSIVSSTGFFFAAHKVLPLTTKLFGFQRTPFIARTDKYGSSANLLGYKKEVAMACENIKDQESFRREVEWLFVTPTKLLNNFYEASLTNSNPILHTGRLYSMWRNWDSQPYDHNILFYREWNDEASKYIIRMDREFMELLDRLPVDKRNIPSLLTYYESQDAASLTRKISTIRAFEGITSPMKQAEGGWVPDFESRYFTEDFPYGLKFIKELAEEHGVETPTIDEVLVWGMSKIGRE